MELSALNPHIRYAKIHYNHSKSADEYNICYDCRLFFAENATGIIDIAGENYNITNSTAIYLPPGTKYRFCFESEQVKIYVLDFDLVSDFAHIKESLGVASENKFQPQRIPLYTPCEPLCTPVICTMPHIQGFLNQCVDNFLQRCSFYREKSSALLKLCLLELIHHNSMRTTYTDLCERVLSYIHENYADCTLTNTDISNAFSYHPYHLSRILKQETGKTLHQYLISYRVRIAKDLLLTSKNNIEQISWQCGFSSTAYFIKAFKDATGSTPKNYRKNHFHPEL